MASRRKGQARRAKQSRQTTRPPFQFHYYVVAWVDLMSQKEKLLRFRDLPDTPEATPAFLASLQDTFGAVTAFRDAFRRYFKHTHPAPSLPNYLSKTQKAQIRELRKFEVRTRAVSDGMVIDLRLDHKQPAPENGILSMFYSCALAVLDSLVNRQPVRGGIDIGWGGDIEPRELYGYGLARAYELETNYAKYPRIVIGGQLHQHLQETKDDEGNAPETQMARKVAEACLGMIAEDDDGLPILHYLGRGHREFIHRAMVGGDIQTGIRLAYDFIAREEVRFREEGDDKLAPKYVRLKAYFDRYMPEWVTHD
jgi:hypothetical protein